MNKRIQELAKQAGVNFFECTNIEHGSREYCEAWIEQQQKFVELIVRKCLLQVADVRIENDFEPVADAALVQALNGIRSYFGIE